MKDWLKKVTGFDKEEKKLESLKKEVEEQENKLLKKKDPKALATKKGEEINVDQSGLSKREWNELMIAFNLKEKII